MSMRVAAVSAVYFVLVTVHVTYRVISSSGKRQKVCPEHSTSRFESDEDCCRIISFPSSLVTMDFHDQVIAAAQLINGNVPSSKPQTGPDRPVPQVSDVDLASPVSQHVIEAVIESLKVSGACIVRNMVSKEGLDEIEKDIRPHLNTAKVWQGTHIHYSTEHPQYITSPRACLSY